MVQIIAHSLQILSRPRGRNRPRASGLLDLPKHALDHLLPAAARRFNRAVIARIGDVFVSFRRPAASVSP